LRHYFGILLGGFVNVSLFESESHRKIESIRCSVIVLVTLRERFKLLHSGTGSLNVSLREIDADKRKDGKRDSAHETMPHCVIEQFKEHRFSVIRSPSKTVSDTYVTECTRQGARISFVVGDSAELICGQLGLLRVPAH